GPTCSGLSGRCFVLDVMAHFSTTVVDRLSCRCVLPGWLPLRCHMASIGWRLPVALGPRVSNDLLSVRVHTPVTRFSLRLSTTAGRPVGGDPIYTTASLQGPEK